MMEAGFERLTAAVGFAICHQLPERSLAFGNRTFFVCARCNGLYLGFALGTLYWIIRRFAGGRPLVARAGTGVLIVAGLAGIPYYLDIWTSYLGLRPTTNAIRLGTGLFFGVAVTMFSLFLLARNSNDSVQGGEVKPGQSVPGWLDILMLNGIALAAFALSAAIPHLCAALLTIAGILAVYSFVGFVLITKFFPRARTAYRALMVSTFVPAILTGLAVLRNTLSR